MDSLHGFKARSETAWKKGTVLRRLLPGIQAVDAAAGDVMKDLHDVNKHGVPFGASFPESANADVDIDLLASDERVEEALKTLSSIEKEEADELAAQQKSTGSGAATFISNLDSNVAGTDLSGASATITTQSVAPLALSACSRGACGAVRQRAHSPSGSAEAQPHDTGRCPRRSQMCSHNVASRGRTR